MAIDVYCDEAGRGGGNLFDDQPWFVLAAHDYSDDEAAGILPPLGRAPEWKWATIRRRPQSLSVITGILENPSLVRSRVSVFLAEKPYVAWLKLYEDLFGDPLNTPPLSRLPHADRLWAAMADCRAMPDVLNAYVRAVRTEDPAEVSLLDSSLALLAHDCGGSDPELGAVIRVLRHNVGELLHGHPSTNAERGANLDPHVAALGVVFEKWAPPGTPYWVFEQKGPPWVRVHHHRIDALPAAYIDFVSRLPGIESLDFVDAAGSPAIQLADVLAGAVALAANPVTPARAESVPLWQRLRDDGVDARFAWEVVAHPRHRSRYPLVRSP